MASSSKSTGSASAAAPERTGREVTLITSDGAKYFVSPSIIKTSRALNGKMKDEQLAAAGGRRGRAPWNRILNLKDFTKECKEINGHTLEQIIEWAKHHKGLWTSKGIPFVLTPWDEEFLSKLDAEDIYTLTLAATDLQIEGLLQLTCKKIAMMLEGKSVEQVREEFGIVNDLSPEQEATIGLENLVLQVMNKGSSCAGGGDDKKQSIEAVTSQQLQTQRAPPAPKMPQLPSQQPNIQKQRRNIWSGLLEWHEKLEGPPDGQKGLRQAPCQVWSNVVNNQPEVNGDGWPAKLIMQLIPKAIVGNLGGGNYFMDVKTVLFMLQECDALASLTRVMESGLAGLVHFIGSGMSGTGSCDIQVLTLLYSKEHGAYLGFIPNDQIGFVDRIRKFVQQQKTQQASLGQGEGQGHGGGQQQMQVTPIEAPPLVLDNVEKDAASTSASTHGQAEAAASSVRKRCRRREKRQRLRQKKREEREDRKKKQEQEGEVKHVHGQEGQDEDVGAGAANDNKDDGEPTPRRLIGDCLWEKIEDTVLKLYRSRFPSHECLSAHIPQMESLCDVLHDRIMTMRASEPSPPAPDKCDCKCHRK